MKKIKEYMNLRYINLIWILVPFLILSCAKENELLVNPPSQSSTVNFRFLNLASDKSARSLSLDSQVETAQVDYNVLSAAKKPPYDSSRVDILQNSNKEFRPYHKAQFIRNLNYVFVALPSASNKANQKAVDTMVTFYSTPSRKENPYKVYVKFLNTNPDTASSYSIRIGCQNGQNLFSNAQYANIAYSALDINQGSYSLSLMKNSSKGEEFIALYQTQELMGKGEYTFILVYDKTIGEKLYILDELNLGQDAYKELTKQTEYSSKFRVVNLSATQIKVDKNGIEPIALDLNSETISASANISTCNSNVADSISVYSNDVQSTYMFKSLEVANNYTMFVFDSAGKRANNAMIVEPVKLYTPLNGKALLRVINANPKNDGINVSLAARLSSNDGSIEAGIELTRELLYKNISSAKIINPGANVPITVFSSERTKYLFSTNYNFEANKSYILVVSRDDQDNIKVYIVEDQEVNVQKNPVNEGAMCQIVNAVPGPDFITFSIENIFSGLKLYYSNSIATVLPIGSHNISIGSKSYTIYAEQNQRNLIVLSGDESNVDILDFSSPVMNASNNLFNRRFINASKLISPISIYNNNSSTAFKYVENLEYGKVSEIVQIYDENKFSLIVKDQSEKFITRADDFKFNFGKNYSVIFIGDSTKSKNRIPIPFSIFVQQEY